MTTEASELTITRLIKASPAQIWKAWTTPEHLARWWIPAPMECKVVKLDVRPGGAFETWMREDDGEWRPHVEGCFVEVVPEARLAFTTVLKAGWRPAEPWLAMTAIMTFEVEEGATRYSARALHKTAADARNHEEMGFQEGWGATIDQLAVLVGGLA
jgi:uncharacterized protein YndB with AHSA1/START domain